ncbi:MAG TPA: hypothetical protein VFT50_17905 [Baekduia sp.]|nr:hypothetical protein [Baekduia sp.]
MSIRASDSTLSVVVADSHREQRDRIRDLIDAQPDLRVAAMASHREQAAELLWRLEPDVAVIELGLLSACEHPLHGWGLIPGGVRLVALGLGEDPWLTATLRAAGFAAYVREERLDDDLCEALRGGRSTGRFERPAPVVAAARGEAPRFERSAVGAGRRPVA